MEKIKENINAFKNSCADCLLKAGLNDLRGYGRSIGMRAATKLKKADLIKEIVGVLCGEIVPSPTKRGAPVKSCYVDPRLIEEIERLKREYLCANHYEEMKQVAESDAPKSELKEKRIVIKDTTGKSVSFRGKALNFQIMIGGSIELVQGETYTICVEEFDK